MRRLALHILLLSVAATAFFGCRHDRTVEALLDRAALCRHREPDSALLLLRSLDGVPLARACDARRRLLLSAIYYNDDKEQLTCELLQPAVRWYGRRGKPADRAAVLFLMAEAQRREGRHEEEMRCYADAQRAAERIDEDSLRHHLLSLIHFNTGTRYAEQNDRENSLESFRLAVVHAEACRDTLQTVTARMMYAQQLTSEDVQAAIEALRPVMEMHDALARRDRELAAVVALLNLHLHARAGDWTPEKMLDERAKIGPAAFGQDKRWNIAEASGQTALSYPDIVSMELFLLADRIDSAARYLERIKQHVEQHDHNNMGLLYYEAVVLAGQEHFEEAYAALERYHATYDSIRRQQAEVALGRMAETYSIEHAAALREQRLRYRILFALLALATVSVAAAWAWMDRRRKLRERDRQIEQQLALLESLRTEHEDLADRLEAQNEREAELKRLLAGRFEMVRELASTCYTYDDGGRLAARVKALALGPATLRDLVETVDRGHDGIVGRLRAAFPDWTEGNVHFAALLAAGCTPQEICILLDLSLNSVYVRKSKLRRRIAESGCADRGEFLRLLGMERA